MEKNIFDDLKRQIKENNARWKKIDKLVDKFKLNDDFEGRIKRLEGLVVLLVEQLRPVGAIDGEKFGEDIKDILNSFSGGK